MGHDVKHVPLILAAVLSLAWASPARAGEELVCAVVHKGADYTAARTDLLSIDPDSGERRILFSDEGLPIVLQQRLYAFHFPVVGGSKLFAHAVARGETQSFPGNGALYELSAGGSNSFRKIAAVVGDESIGDIFADSTGERLGYVSRLDGRQYVIVHDVETGGLLRRIDVTDLVLDCHVSGMGWSNGGRELFFSLETGDADLTSEESYEHAGVYAMDTVDDRVTKLKPVPALEGYGPPHAQRVIGVLPPDRYVIETEQHPTRAPGKGSGSHFAVVVIRPGTGLVEDVSFDKGCGLYSGVRVEYRISQSGRYLAAAPLTISSSSSSCDVCIKDLRGGAERVLLSIPTDGLDGPFLGLVGWFY
jgi:hypothetical protein